MDGRRTAGPKPGNLPKDEGGHTTAHKAKIDVSKVEQLCCNHRLKSQQEPGLRTWVEQLCFNQRQKSQQEPGFRRWNGPKELRAFLHLIFLDLCVNPK